MNNQDLSILCVTRGDDSARPHLAAMRDLAVRLGAECMLVADGVPAALRLREWGLVAGSAPVLYSRGYIESILDDAILYTHAPYVLRLDDDERCSPAMERWLDRGAYRLHDHWKFPRQHIWPADGWALRTPHLYPDHQTRLSSRAKSGGRRAVHAGSPFGGGEDAPCCIWHYKFTKPYADRLKIARGYDAFAPGYGTGSMLPFSLPEDAYGSVEVASAGDGTAPWQPTVVQTCADMHAVAVARAQVLGAAV